MKEVSTKRKYRRDGGRITEKQSWRLDQVMPEAYPISVVRDRPWPLVQVIFLLVAERPDS